MRRAAKMVAGGLLLGALCMAGPVLAADGASLAEKYPDGLVLTVAEGDTFWDLSAKYLGSPWKWTEMWERNRHVTNPHYIYPGVKVVIFPPSTNELTMTVPAAAKSDTAPAPAPIAASAPAPSAVIKNSYKPPALPPTRTGPPNLADYMNPTDAIRSGEFLKIKPVSIGFIVGGREPKVAFSKGDEVFVEISKSLPKGQLIGVYRVRPDGKIAGPDGKPTSGFVRYLVGVLRLQGAEGKDKGVVAQVIDSFEDIGNTDLLSEEIPGFTAAPINAGAAGLEASVVAGRFMNKEMSVGEFIYLDRGSNAGVAVGNVFRLYDKVEASVDGGLVQGAVNEVGAAIIVRVSADYSTAFLAETNRSFEAGVTARRGSASAK